MVTNSGRIVLYCIVDVQGRIADVDVDVDVDLNVDVAEAVEHLPSNLTTKHTSLILWHIPFLILVVVYLPHCFLSMHI